MPANLFRASAFLLSLACYAVFLLVFLYLLAFLGNLQGTALAEKWPWVSEFVPLSIDYGRDMGSPAIAVAVDITLMALFGLQHSVMARPGFKRAWTRLVPKELERSAYVLLSSLVLALLLWQWRPIPMPLLWHAESSLAIALGWSVMGLGVANLLWATFLINHFELFGLQQGWLTLRGRPLLSPAFVTPWLYKIVRHPLYVGWLLIFWGAPVMTAGHLLFALGLTLYVLVAIPLEERDLIHVYGERYREYQRRVRALLPFPRSR